MSTRLASYEWGGFSVRGYQLGQKDATAVFPNTIGELQDLPRFAQANNSPARTTTGLRSCSNAAGGGHLPDGYVIVFVDNWKREYKKVNDRTIKDLGNVGGRGRVESGVKIVVEKRDRLSEDKGAKKHSES